ncbi:uncharacterized protein LOC127843707 isoform X6 [Dreissena polymorpha]|uniref:uncharacterized protein LOC127843707 isoform X6 n=1 Tax=Dreissena polymorpha TaxID=45954 RepID=UPI0022643E23|nr:uncharacterized protein LOC127843707 isoform X6 [Dreissena polymorpha]
MMQFALKNRKGTLQAFKDDIKWAQDDIKWAQGSGNEERPCKSIPERELHSESEFEPEPEQEQDPASDHVSNSGSSGNEEPPCKSIPERELHSESEFESEPEQKQDPASDHVSNSGSSENEGPPCKSIPERELHSESEFEPEPEQEQDPASDHVSNSGSSAGEEHSDMEQGSDNSDDDAGYSKAKKRGEVTDNDILRDSEYPEIYIRKQLKKANSVSGQAYKKKHSRVYNNYHACYYCKELFLHIPVHMKTHRNISEVRHELKKTQPDFSSLRKLGDDQHNRDVVNQKKGELIIARKSNEKTLDITKYGPCVNCREWMLLSGLKKHFRTCAKGEKRGMGKKDLVITAQILAGHVVGKPSKMMLEEVYRIMKDDECSRTAKNDVLILSLGESWLRRNIDNNDKRKYYASGRMRLCARLLIALKAQQLQTKSEENEVTCETMWDFLMPSKFDDFVTASLAVSMPHMDDMEDLRAPSNAIKLKYDIRRLLNAKYAYLLRASDVVSNEIKQCKRFLKLMEIEWGERVTKVARTVLQTRRLTETKEVPAPDDVEKLTRHLVNELENTKMTPENYARIVQLCQTRLLLFNKRRSGELEVLNLQSYLQRSSSLSDLDESISKDLTEVEKHLLKTQDLVMIRGKRGAAVPVIVPQDANKPLEFITNAEVREAAGVQRCNKYLFANRGTQYVRAYDSLKSVCDEVTLKAPARITSVSMRKYMATLTQLMGLDKYQLDWVCKHLGHTKSVHNTAYRQMSGMVERVYISKLLMIQDLNLTGKFKGKNLEDIDVSELLAEHQSMNQEPDAVAESDAVNCNDIATPIEYNSGSDVETGENELSSDDSEDDTPPKKRRRVVKTNTRQKWSVDEVAEIKEYFKTYLDSGITPRNKEVQLAMAKSRKNNGILWMRKTHLIIKKISNLNKDKR